MAGLRDFRQPGGGTSQVGSPICRVCADVIARPAAPGVLSPPVPVLMQIVTAQNSAAKSQQEQQAAQQKKFTPLVKQFLDYLNLEKHFSDYTVKSYGADLIQYGQFLTGEIGHTNADP